MIHHTMGVYNDGSRKHNGVASEDLASHIWYNLNLRPGRALFVDGFCLNEGYLSKERCEAIESELKAKPVIMQKCTVPYQ